MVSTFFLNDSGIMGQVIGGLTTNVTGSTFGTYLLMVTLIIVFALAFRIPLEFTAILIYPMLIVIAAYNSDFIGILGTIAIYSGILLAKNFFISGR